MGEEKLLQALEDEALRESSAIVEKAEDARKAELLEVERDIKALRAARLGDLKEVLLRESNAMLGEAGSRAKGLMLEAKFALLDDVFRRSIERVKGLGGKEYRQYLTLLFDELERVWPKEASALAHVNPSDVDILKGRGVEVVPDAAVSLGVVFVSSDGRYRFENTAASRIERLREAVTVELNQILFKG
jgi:vacuolar-type H+-ATPase subunit E/Vma4